MDKKMTPVEKKIMDYFWAKKKSLCKRDLMEYFTPDSMSGTNISFYLSTMSHSGYLTAERRGRSVYYLPTMSENEYNKKLIRYKMNKKLDMSLEEMLASYCGAKELTDSKSTAINEWLAKLERALKKC